MTRVPPARGGQATAVKHKPAGVPVKKGPSATTIRQSQRVTIQSVTPPKLTVTALLDADRPQPTQGYGGWSTLQRVRRRSVLEWDGGAPWQIDVKLVLDGGDRGHSIEDDCDALEEMAISPGPLQPPPLITIDGPFSKATAAAQWVISDIAWGHAWVLANGDRRQQFVTVSLLQHASETLAQTATKKAKATAKASTPYIVKAGDTLDTIAADVLGSVARKREIVALNLPRLRDPRNLKKGMHLVMPAKK